MIAKHVLAILAIVAIAITPAFSQTTGGSTLVGTVTDSSGSVIPAAKVTVINQETSFRSETVTREDGSYYVPYLNPGTYLITLEAAGFKRYQRDGVMIRTGETPRVDIALEVGAVTEAITVSAAAPLLATETALAGGILEGSTLRKIPTPQGALVRSAYYFPGVSTTASGSSAGGQFHILGQRNRAIGFTLDGMTGKTPGTDNFGQTDQMLQPNQEGIQEMKVITSGMPAEFGHSAGGQVSLVFKSGTNQLHGSLDERYIGKGLTHRDYFQQSRDNTPFYYDWFDSSFSGPVYIPKIYNGKNRTFFLTTFGGFLQSGGVAQQRLAVPSEAMYRGDFSFGGQGLPIYNPLTTRQEGGRWVRDPFPGNQIPASMFDPVAKNFLERKPFSEANDPGIMTATGPTQNFIAYPPKFVHRYRWDEKIDHQFSPRNKIFGRYSQVHEPVYYNGGNFRPALAWRFIDPSAQLTPTDNYNGVVSHTFVFGPNRFNELRVGYNRRDYRYAAESWGQDWGKQLGIPNISPQSFPYFAIGFSMGSLGRSYQRGDEGSIQNNFTQIVGPHTIKAGYEVLHSRYNSALATTPSGTYNFGGTEAPFTPNTGNTFASFLLGTVSSGVFTQDFATWLPRWTQHAWYVQDDWKLARGLTLNLGLRWSYESPFGTKYGQQSQFDPNATDPLTGRRGAITHPKGPLAKRDLNNFQPRLGLAWSFRPKWVFRSSFGIMTADLKVNGINQNFQEYVGTANVQAAPGDPSHAFRLSEGPQSFRYQIAPDGSTPFVGTNYGARTADWYDPNMRMPYIMSWSGGFQYEFSRNWLAEAMYQGTAGVGLLNNWNINVIPLDISSDLTVLNQIFMQPQNYLPYPQFGNVNLYSNFGHSTYHSGTLRVEKRYSAGVNLIAVYTFSKTLDESDGDGTATGITYYNRRLEKARAGYDIRHHFMSVLTYEFPFGKGRPWLNRGGIVNAVLGGWDLTWTTTLESGMPTDVTFAGGPNRYLPGGVSRPHALVPIEQAVVKDWQIGPNRFPTSAQNPYLKFDAFAYPAPFTAGSLGRNMFESPGMHWHQFSLSKGWMIRERARFQLRVDMNNFPFKQPEFLQPNSTYNINNRALFGTFTLLRQPYSEIGNSRPHMIVGGRVQF